MNSDICIVRALQFERREYRAGHLNRVEEMRAGPIPLFLSFSFLYFSWPVGDALMGGLGRPRRAAALLLLFLFSSSLIRPKQSLFHQKYGFLQNHTKIN